MPAGSVWTHTIAAQHNQRDVRREICGERANGLIDRAVNPQSGSNSVSSAVSSAWAPAGHR